MHVYGVRGRGWYHHLKLLNIISKRCLSRRHKNLFLRPIMISMSPTCFRSKSCTFFVLLLMCSLLFCCCCLVIPLIFFLLKKYSFHNQAIGWKKHKCKTQQDAGAHRSISFFVKKNSRFLHLVNNKLNLACVIMCFDSNSSFRYNWLKLHLKDFFHSLFLFNSSNNRPMNSDN